MLPVTIDGKSVSVEIDEVVVGMGTSNIGAGDTPVDTNDPGPTGMSGGAVAGSIIPILLVIGAVFLWFKCRSTAGSSAELKLEYELEETRRNTVEMEQNPMVARRQAAAAAAAAAATALDPTLMAVDYLEPAVVGTDYEYGPVGAAAAAAHHLCVEPNAEYAPAATNDNGAPLYSVYAGSSTPFEQAAYVEPNAEYAPAATNDAGNTTLYSVPMEEEAGVGPVKIVQVYGTTVEDDDSVYNAPGANTT